MSCMELRRTLLEDERASQLRAHAHHLCLWILRRLFFSGKEGAKQTTKLGTIWSEHLLKKKKTG